MSIETFLNRLKYLIGSETDQEPAIYQLISSFFGNRSRDGAVHFVYANVCRSAFGKRDWNLFGQSAIPFEDLANRNLKVCLRLLQRLVYLPAPECEPNPDPLERPFLFPFVLTACLRVDQPMEDRNFLMPFDQTVQIKRELERFFEPVSAAKPMLLDRLFPVSAFSCAKEVFSESHRFAQNYFKSLADARTPSRTPNFRKHDAGPDFFDPELMREYRMLFGVACLKVPPECDPVHFLLHACDSHKNSPSVELVNSVSGCLPHEGVRNSKFKVNVDCSRVTLNRPFPALGGFNHFMDEIFVNDHSDPDFWEYLEQLSD